MKRFEELVDQQGWNDTTQASLMREFIRAHGLDRQLAEFAGEVATEENSPSH
jgi:hypothetical protein